MSVILKIATWNINSVRLRIDQVVRFLTEYNIDVLCLQEIKCLTQDFPYKAFKNAGYDFAQVHGQKGYHGVAVVSKFPLSQLAQHDFASMNESRYQACVVECGKERFEVHNFYIPAGGDIPDVILNPKFAQKLKFIDETTKWSAQNFTNQRGLLVGDFNIAPLETDVWSHKQLLDVVSHTPIECEKLLNWQKQGKFIDIIRTFYPEPMPIFTWWSYRAQDWQTSNRGRRLDHIWATSEIAACVCGLDIISETRNWVRPSDHVPVIAQIKI